MEIGTRFTNERYFNYDTGTWESDIWEDYDVESGAPVADHTVGKPDDQPCAPQK